jgi:hypothetical protein
MNKIKGMDTVEVVISPVLDSKLQDNLSTSLIWKECYKESEVTDFIKHKHKALYKYSIKFSGLKPIQCLKIDLL